MEMKIPLSRNRWLPTVAILLGLAVAGCERNSVKVYKDDSSNAVVSLPPPTSAGAMPATMPDGLPVPDNSSLPKLKYTLPEGWKEKNLTQLRVASFGISENGKTADVSVIPLSGMAGGDVANVNRWRKDVGQTTLAGDDDLKKIAEPVTIAGQAADLYDLAGTNPGTGDEEGILAAILHNQDTAWFFKMSGDAEVVKKNKPAFIAFLKSVEFGKPAADSSPAAMDMSQLPAGHPALPGQAATADTSTGDKPSWTVPAGWKEGELAQFLVAKYVIETANGAAAVNVSQLNGDGGGLLANLNRWRKQLGQQAIAEDDVAKLPTLDAGGKAATVADFTGTDAKTGKPARLVGVVVPGNGQTWFYKLMGDPELVAQQKDALIQFVQSAKYPAAK